MSVRVPRLMPRAYALSTGMAAMGPATTVGAVTAREQAAAARRMNRGIVRIVRDGCGSQQSCVYPALEQERGEPEGRPAHLGHVYDTQPRYDSSARARETCRSRESAFSLI